VGAKQKRNTIQLRADILNFSNLLKNSWGVGYNSTASTNGFTAAPVTIANANTVNGASNGNPPTYRFATQNVVGADGKPQTVLLYDSFLKSATVNDVWQLQVGLRYIFN
jgi:hypothetical protein